MGAGVSPASNRSPRAGSRAAGLASALHRPFVIGELAGPEVLPGVEAHLIAGNPRDHSAAFPLPQFHQPVS